MSTYRNWCFTVYSDCGDEIRNESNVRYAIYQKEKCPTTGRFHWQGYVEFKTQYRLSGVRKILPTAHWEPRKGTREEARDYCRKEESREEAPVEIGTWVSSDGSRRIDDRIAKVKKLIDEGKTVDEICDIDFGVWLKHGKRLIDYMGVRMRLSGSTNLRLDLQVEVRWGVTGTGKTRGVFEENPKLYKLDSANNIWWDGYMGEEVLLIDDFYGWIKFGSLLNILDIYPLRLEVKGGFAYACWRKVYITSNKRWEEWYKDLTHEQHQALQRRIHTVKVYDI